MAYRGGREGVLSFETFFEGWLVRQNQYLEQLRSAAAASSDKEVTSSTYDKVQLKTLIKKVSSHYQQYYEAKSIVCRRDVFILFAPPWLNPYEKTFLWITGFKPGFVLKVALNHSVRDLTDEQKKSINKLTEVTRAREKELSDELALIQESFASPGWVNLTKRRTDDIIIDDDGGGGGEDTAESALLNYKQVMEGLVVGADYLRITTATKLAEILNPCQTVRFLAAATQLQLSIRMLGSKKQAAAASASASCTQHQHQQQV